MTSISNVSKHRWTNATFFRPVCFSAGTGEKHTLWTFSFHLVDIGLWLKICRAFEFEQVEETIAYAHQHAGAKTTGEKQQMRAETILLVTEHGGEAVARREAMKMDDDLSEANRKVSRITDNVLYRTLVGPMYRLFRSWTNSSSQA